jgi:Ca-activated chloride channel family protein
MQELSGSVTKLAAAQAAARQFVGQLELGKDQAALVTFNATVTVDAPLTGDRAALLRAIDGITTGAGTRIDLALDEAYRELNGDRVKPGNTRVLILMTDGRPDAGTADLVRAAAARLRASGVVIYTIGFGADVDPVLLTEIATSPSTYYQAPDAAALAGIYTQVAGDLPCPGGVIWDRP